MPMRAKLNLSLCTVVSTSHSTKTVRLLTAPTSTLLQTSLDFGNSVIPCHRFWIPHLTYLMECSAIWASLSSYRCNQLKEHPAQSDREHVQSDNWVAVIFPGAYTKNRQAVGRSMHIHPGSTICREVFESAK